MFRTEHDFLGDMDIDDAFYYGIQTIRGMRVSADSGRTLGQDGADLLHFLALLKKAAAAANMEIGALEPKIGKAILATCDEIIAGRLNDHFPVDLFTGGGGITVHMNVNEVVANRASEILTGKKGYDPVHPNTHVNMGQSTNDILPSAMLLALHKRLEELAAQVDLLHAETTKKATEFQSVVKIGRTCYQDAVPITLGQEFSGYAAFLARQSALLKTVATECLEIPLGATAVGTEIGTLPGLTEQMQKELCALTGERVVRSANYFDSLQNGDIYAKVSFAMKSLAMGISKMAMDLRVMSSGPRSGFGEIKLPELLPGSSIMPGKINPILPELVCQVCYQVCGNDVAVTMAVENGDLDLNVWEAIITKCLFESSRLLTNSVARFATHCIAGITANEKVCQQYAESSISLAAAVSAVFGYETGSAVAREAAESGKTILQVVLDRKLLAPECARELLAPLHMTDAKKMQDTIAKIRTSLGQK